MSTLDVAAGAIRRDETVEIVLLLVFAGLGVRAMADEFAKALHFVPPILAFAVGIVIARWLRRCCGSLGHQAISDLTLGMRMIALLRCEVMPREANE
jgi:uncharacterized membrane protein YoaK (UPF0700 family)